MNIVLHRQCLKSRLLDSKTLLKPFISSTKRDFHSSSITESLSSAATLQKLKQTHSLIITSGLHQSDFYTGKLITKYAHLRDPISSQSVFRQASDHKNNNVFLWNSIIRALTQNGIFTKALDFYSELMESKLRPDRFTFPSVINACAGLLDFDKARSVHECVLDNGFGSDLYIANSLIDMYSRFGYLNEAHKVFDEMPYKDVVSWNSLISGYGANGGWEKALEIYYQLRIGGVKPDSFTVSSVLPACGSLNAIDEGQLVHGLVYKIGIQNDILVNNGLLSMYCKFEILTDVERVFDEMEVRDTVSWNTMICGYTEMGAFKDAIKLFQDMVTRYKPDILTLTSVLRACSNIGDLEQGKYCHGYMKRNGYECDTMAGNILMTMYAKCGDLQASHEVFNGMKCKDSVSWNSLIHNYIQNDSYKDAMESFKMMNKSEPMSKLDSITHVILLSICTKLVDLRQGKTLQCNATKLGFGSYLNVCNALVHMYVKCGSIEDALKQFEKMRNRDMVTWNTFIAGCVQYGHYSFGLKMISRMRKEGLIPDVATMLGILPACSFLATKLQGKEIHGCIFKLGFESYASVGNALIDTYAKCGSLRNALHVFNLMEVKDVITWTAMIFSYGMYGQGKEALRAFREMEAMGTTPDHIAFLAVLYGCSHSGLVQEGWASFERMKKEYNIEPRIEHYACVVDLLSRNGLLVEAEKFILAMPMKPDASVWGALLSACRVTGGTEIAERVSKQILELDSGSTGTGYYVLVSNVYAALGNWDQVRKIRKSIESKGLKKDPGCSWIEIRKKVYVFGTGDRIVEQSEEVYQLLERLTDLMVKEGYVADKRLVLHDVEEDEKKDMLCGHNERLAIAFGLLNTSPGTPLQIMKNLRVCGDCHTVTKYISMITRRELLVRDANRFHLFKDGACNCGDHW